MITKYGDFSGQLETSELAFRAAYICLCELKSFCDVPVIGMTAAATDVTRGVHKSLRSE